MTRPSLSKIENDLTLDREQLRTIASTLRDRILEGFAKPNCEIKALPTYLPPPAPHRTGRAIVVDTGGTNMRAALVDLDGQGKIRIVRGPRKKPVPSGRGGKPIPGDAFFDAQAALVAEVEPDPNCPVGYCFSYPAESLPDRDARLIRWTKGLRIEGVEGSPVGARLKEAIERRGVQTGPVAVINDTVASLLGGYAVHRSAMFSNFIGVIVGTGTNMAGFFPVSRLTKLDPGDLEPTMAVNLESGNFSPPYLSSLDEALDRSSNNPGAQRFEKAVSGYYLPFLFREACPDAPGFDPAEGSARLVEFKDRADDSRECLAATLILQRSADLVAAALVAVAQVYESEGPIAICAEGTLILKSPGFQVRVIKTFEQLTGGQTVRVVSADDVNLVGAACAALIPR